MDDYEIARRMTAIPEQFADRIDERSLATLTEFTQVGEWGEALDLVVACLAQDAQTITSTERDELRTLAEAMQIPTDEISQLHIRDAQGGG